MTLAPVPSFDRARRVSSIVALLSSLGMAGIILGVAAGAIALLFFFDPLREHIAAAVTEILSKRDIAPEKVPEVGTVLATLEGLTLIKRAVLAAVIAGVLAPSFFILFHLRALFVKFAAGQVFTDTNIAQLRLIGLWLVASVVVTAVGHFIVTTALSLPDSKFNWNVAPLFYGAITYVAAYVMSEGRRIADDNAGIV